MPRSQIAVFAVVAILTFSNQVRGSDIPNFPGPILPGLSALEGESDSSCGPEKPDHDPQYLATGISDWATMSNKQRSLLGAYLAKHQSGLSYNQWVEGNNGRASAFLAITNALDRTTLHSSAGDHTALDLITGINQILVERLMVELDPAKFQEWNRAGGRFTINRLDGRTERGRVKFRDHTVLGSSLHCGYEVQGATSMIRAPRIQWNYRYSDSEADIDIDGYSAFAWGFIPNPKHLTRANSDVRHWVKKYSKKFGNPGFSVQKMH